MAKLINQLLGLVLPNRSGAADPRPQPTPPMQIPGAHNARELAMLCQDANLPSTGTLEFVRQHANPAGRLVQLKADGIRALYIDGRIVSREGAPLDCALQCQPGLARLENSPLADNRIFGGGQLVFDGEYVADEGFNATLTEHKKGEGTGVFWIFDVLPLADWRQGRCDIPIETRLAFLRDLVLTHCDSHFVGMLDAWTLTPEETIAKAREIWAAGGEGVVSKRMGSPYVRERSADWLRIKQTFTVDAPIIDMVGTAEGTLKVMIVRAVEGPVRIGTGWTVGEGRAMLREFNAGRDTWAEISFQKSTGAKRSFRGARFHRVRNPKGNI